MEASIQTTTWWRRYGEVLAYARTYGHPPRGHQWLMYQRRKVSGSYPGSPLDSAKLDALRDLPGWEEPRRHGEVKAESTTWWLKYNDVLEQANKSGHPPVRNSWLMHQRNRLTGRRGAPLNDNEQRALRSIPGWKDPVLVPSPETASWSQLPDIPISEYDPMWWSNYRLVRKLSERLGTLPHTPWIALQRNRIACDSPARPLRGEQIDALHQLPGWHAHHNNTHRDVS